MLSISLHIVQRSWFAMDAFDRFAFAPFATASECAADAAIMLILPLRQSNFLEPLHAATLASGGRVFKSLTQPLWPRLRLPFAEAH